MTTDFSELLYQYLPGIYRDKDESGELRRFLEIAGQSMSEIEASIAQLYDDFYISTCRDEFVALIGGLVGAEVDPTLPARAQSSEVEDAVASYRRKGLKTTLAQYAGQATAWPLATVDFSQTVGRTAFVEGLFNPDTATTAVFDISDPSKMPRLGRSDDPAPYTLDIRAPRLPTDRIGRHHFDNHGFFATMGRIVANQKPNMLTSGAGFARFTFDNRPLALGHPNGYALQLADAIDGSALTRRKFAAEPFAFAGNERGFRIRARGVELSGFRFANLDDFDQPRDVSGNPFVPGPADLLVDPQLGRFALDLAAWGIAAQDLRVDYLLAEVEARTSSIPLSLSNAIPEVFSFSVDGRSAQLRDALDGTPVSVKLRFGSLITDFHDTARGWIIYRNGAGITGALTPELKPIATLTESVSANHVAIDLERGRFKLPSGFIQPGDVFRVDVATDNSVRQQRIFDSLAQRLQRRIPAGAVPVLINTRKAVVNPADLVEENI